MHRALPIAALALACSSETTTNVYPSATVTMTGTTSSLGGTGAGSGGEGGAAIGGGGSETTTGLGGSGGLLGCASASACPGVDDACQHRTCIDGACGMAFTASGTAVAAQVPGDCASVVCDGAGATTSSYDAADLKPDGVACTVDACTPQGPTYTEIGAAPICHATCLPLDPAMYGPARVTCSGVVVDDGGDGADFLGILWTDDQGTVTTGDDTHHKCGDIAALSNAPGCGCQQYLAAGTCMTGMPCTIVRLWDNGTQYVGGKCE